MLRILVTGRYGEIFVEPIKSIVGSRGVVEQWLPLEGEDTLLERMPNVDVLVASAEWMFAENSTLAPKSLQSAPNLKLLLVPFSGMEWLNGDWLPKGCVACSTNAGIPPIAEYVLAAILESLIHLREMDSELREGRWTWGGSTVLGRKHRELGGRTIGFIGYGRIAKRVCELADAFGMRSIAVSRNPKPDDRLAWWKDMAAFDRLLAESDFILLTVPGGVETENMIDTAQIEKMKSDAVLINVARGSVINEEALYHALLYRRIGGAVIDTWYKYPTQGEQKGKSASLPFEKLDNIIMTPHAAGWTEELESRRVAAISENIRLFMSGQLMNDVYLTK